MYATTNRFARQIQKQSQALGLESNPVNKLHAVSRDGMTTGYNGGNKEATMSDNQVPQLETDPRFPSGPWTGFFLQKELPGRHQTDLRLTFHDGNITGEGRDRVGDFLVKGRYNLVDGKCYWTKKYLGKHDVFYDGFNEGKGIWGVWQIGQLGRGGFHIWPEGLGDPTHDHLVEEADVPASADELVEAGAFAERKVP